MVDMEEKITELNVSEEAVAETTAEVTEDVVVEMTEEEAAEVSENLEKLEQKGSVYKNAAEKHKHLSLCSRFRYRLVARYRGPRRYP